jgi:DNA invertase Pin-like site-specific DNA recombinase
MVRWPFGKFSFSKSNQRGVCSGVIAYSYIRFSHADQLLGDSLRRQTEITAKYAEDHGMTLDDSLRPDLAVSAFRGKHRTKGHLADFVRKVQSGDVKRGSALLVESLDRLSREEPEEAYDFLRDLLRAGIEVHAVKDGEVYRHGEMDEFRIMKAVLTHSRSSQESKRKSERCTQAAAQARKAIQSGKCVSARLPGWLEGEKGGRITIIPERVEIIRRIYRMAAEGMGATRIADILIEEGVPCWTYVKRWSAGYISFLLRSRAVHGEFQPGTHPRGGVWTASGPLQPNYFPRIIDEALWARVQVLRAKRFARGKIAVGTYHGNGGRSNWRNLFLRLCWDEQGNTMVFQSVQQRWTYLISNNRKLFRTHKIRYAYFKTAILQMLDDLDWKTLLTVKTDKNLVQQLKSLSNRIVELEKLRKRYLRVIEGDEELDDLLISRYKESVRQLAELKTAKEALQNQINQDLPKTLDGIPTIVTFEANKDTESKDYQLRLRDEIRKRISRIDLTFNAEIFSAPDPNKTIANVKPGKGKIVAKVSFANGAIKWAIIEGDRAVLLSGGEYAPTAQAV